MPYCCAYGCRSNETSGVSFFRFPKDSKMRRIWVSKVNRKDWRPTLTTVLCSDHFENDAYETDPELLKSLGFRKKPRLRDVAIPTLFSHVGVNGSRKRRKASEKRHRQQVVNEMVLAAQATNVSDFKDGSPTKEHPHPRTAEATRKSHKGLHHKTRASVSKNQERESKGIAADALGSSQADALGSSQQPHLHGTSNDPNSKTTCQFQGCASDKVDHPERTFFQLPECAGARRDRWLQAINWPRSYSGDNAELIENIQWKSHAVCSQHFITGKPSDDHAHPDHVPTVYPRALTLYPLSQQLSNQDLTNPVSPVAEFQLHLDEAYSTDARFIRCHPRDLSSPSEHSKCMCTVGNQPCPRAMAWVLTSELPAVTRECLAAILSQDESERQSLVFTYQSTNPLLKSMTPELTHSCEQLAAVVGSMLSTYFSSVGPSTVIPKLDYCGNSNADKPESQLTLSNNVHEVCSEHNTYPVLRTESVDDELMTTIEVSQEVVGAEVDEQGMFSCGDDLVTVEIKKEVIDVEEDDNLGRLSSHKVCRWEFKDGKLIPKVH